MAWLPKNTILVPLDFSEAAFAALDVALELAEGPTHIRVLHVLHPLSSADPGVLFGQVTNLSRIEKATDSVKQKLTDSRFEGVGIEVRVGSPTKEIVAYAGEIEADLIVLPARGAHALEAFHIGSTANRVVQLAKCPVLVTK